MNRFVNRMSTATLAVVLAASVALPAFAAQFVDIRGHWAQQSIETLAQQGIITGYPTGEFKPQGQVTRAEFAAMLVKAMGWENQFEDNGSNFVDVPRSSWAYRPIEIVSDKGIVNGYPGGYYRPGQSITRTEAMAILVNAARIPQPADAEADQILRSFGDGQQVPQWARRSVAAAIQSGIFVNFPSTSLVEASRPITRAEVAAMTHRLQDYQVARSGPRPPAPAMANQGQWSSPAPQQQPFNPQPQPFNPQSQPPMVSANPQGGYTAGSITQQGNMLRGHVMVVPAQTVFTGIVTTPFSSDRSNVGDPVAVTLDRPIISAAGDIVVPQGSQVFGNIVRIEPAGAGEKNAGVDIDFNRVVTPTGQTFPLSAEINAEGGILKGGTTKGRAARIAGRTVGGAAVGAASGAVLGRITGGKKRTDEGLMWGAILGSGLGAASAVASKGEEVIIEPGEGLELRLRQPLSVSNPQ